MLTYLIKTSLIWLLLLVVYECLYARNKFFVANRTYLLSTMLLGTVLPLIPIHFITNGYIVEGNAVSYLGNATYPSSAATQNGPSANVFHLSWSEVLIWLYIAGAAILLLLTLREIITIIRYAVYGHCNIISSHKIFKTPKKHAPFSFMGWIFISDEENYSDEQLGYIICHEAAHNKQRHWLDILIMQTALIVFWFHPLVWRIRYHLKMQHEYEADAIASRENAYGYGHFLLQYKSRLWTPVIAHSFFYSPIKNRVSMLTKNQNKLTVWRYMAIIPVLSGCLIFLSSATNNSLQRVRVGDKTTFKGNDFYWTTQTMRVVSMNPKSKVNDTVTTVSDVSIYQMNNDTVFNNESVSIAAQYRNSNKTFSEYFNDRMLAIKDRVPDSIAQVQILNAVVDTKGKIAYYDILYLNTKMNKDNAMGSNHNRVLDPIIDNIITESGNWNAGIKDGKPVCTFLKTTGVAAIHSLSLSIKAVDTIKTE